MEAEIESSNNGLSREKTGSLEKRLNLLKHLRKNDSLLFEYADKGPEYFHILTVPGNGWVSGKYIDANGKVDSRSLSLQYLAQVDLKVAYYQPLSSEQ